jgi:group II intron reverse transcriptase/maturase
MRNPTVVMNNLRRNAAKPEYQYDRLYRNFFNQDFFLIAYNNIYAKPGNMTKGTDDETIDGMSLERISKIIQALKKETYQPRPTRRTYITKKNGKQRPLGIPCIDDKLVQEVTRMLLESIWEPQFQKCSHGFRPSKSCHTALDTIQKTFGGVKWFIEGDIKGFFDNINHHILIILLRKRINDERFISLIWKFLKAGYLENWQYHTTYTGTPQGSIISPILSNIYLHELDMYMMEHKSHFDKGLKKRRTTEYRRIESQKYQIKKKYSQTWAELSVEQKATIRKSIKKLDMLMLSTSLTNPFDPDFKRLFYVRYADDWLCGVIGSKKEAEQIKQNISRFLRDKLNLVLSQEKTLITHSAKKAHFLGYDITVARNLTPKRNTLGRLQRAYNNTVRLYLPKEVWLNKLKEYGTIKILPNKGREIWKPVHRKYLQNKTDLEIIRQYNQEVRGIYNYYKIANNAATLHKFNYFMYYGMLKTYARKYKSSVKKVRKKFDVNGEFGIKYETKKGTRFTAYYNEGFRRQKAEQVAENIEIKIEYKYPFGRYSPGYRLKNRTCELCEAHDVNVWIHHVRKLQKIKPDTPWNVWMIENRKKTISVCNHCYQLIRAATI